MSTPSERGTLSPTSASSISVVLTPAEKLAPLLGPARTDSEIGRRITAGTAALLIANEPAHLSPRKAVQEETKITSKFGFSPSVIPPGRSTPTLADTLENPPSLQQKVSFAPPESITPRHVASRNTPGGITDHITPGGDAEAEVSHRPKDTKFKQQRLPSLRPLMFPKHLLTIYFVFGGLFLPLGLGILVSQFQLVEVEHRYDETCGNPCNATLVIPHDIDPPIFVHYKLYGFYQNHRRYVKSRSEDQLTGKDVTKLTGCDRHDSISNDKVVYPCGYIANSFFNDSFTASLCASANSTACVALNSTEDWAKDIVWNDDYKRFKVPSDLDPSLVTQIAPDGMPHLLPNVSDEDFMVWMRPSGFPNFRKLYRKINRPMYKGQVLKIQITNQFPVSTFKGDKGIAISTVNWFGGKNSFIAWIYVGISILFIGGGFIMLALEKIFPRRVGDMRYFYWSETNAKYD